MSDKIIVHFRGMTVTSGSVTITKDNSNLIGISIGGGATLCPCLYIVQVNIWHAIMQIRVLLTNCMEHSCLWEASSSSDSPEIPCVIWKPKVHCHVHMSLLFESLLYHMNSVIATPSSFFRIHCIFLPSMPKSPECPLTEKPCMHFSSLVYVPCVPLLDLISAIWWGAQIIKLLYVQFSALSC